MPKPSANYQGRAKRARSERAVRRAQVRKVMRDGLKEATKRQLYDRTPLPVTGKMRKSIFTKSDRNSIMVGYKASIAPHAGYRLQKKGKSKLGGHWMTMTPAGWIIGHYGHKIRRIGKGSLERITA